jgi:hypothetical protein
LPDTQAFNVESKRASGGVTARPFLFVNYDDLEFHRIDWTGARVIARPPLLPQYGESVMRTRFKHALSDCML